MGMVVGVGMAVASLASGVLDIINQNAIDAAGREQAEQLKQNALVSLRTQGAVTRSKTAQERAQVVEEVTNITNQALRLRGANAARAGGGEAAGRTVADVQMDISRAAGTVRSRLSTLQEFREIAAEQSIQALVIQTQGRITSGAYIPYRITSPVAVATEAIGAGFQGYALGKSF